MEAPKAAQRLLGAPRGSCAGAPYGGCPGDLPKGAAQGKQLRKAPRSKTPPERVVENEVTTPYAESISDETSCESDPRKSNYKGLTK